VPAKPKPNDHCPCGSKLRFRKCCMAGPKAKRRQAAEEPEAGGAPKDKAAEGDADAAAAAFKTLLI
jgi:hypothetical protein